MKAYEYAPHKYIIVVDRELEALQKKYEPRIIRISYFIQNDEIDSIFLIIPILLVLSLGMKNPIC